MKIQTINRLFSTRAAMMLLMMLLTTTTAWAGEYTVTYRANISHTGNSYSAILERNDDNSKKATIVTSGSGWSGGTGVRVDDEYDVTFTPSNNLSIATNPGTHTATGFIMSSGDFTASVRLDERGVVAGGCPEGVVAQRSAVAVVHDGLVGRVVLKPDDGDVVGSSRRICGQCGKGGRTGNRKQ